MVEVPQWAFDRVLAMQCAPCVTLAILAYFSFGGPMETTKAVNILTNTIEYVYSKRGCGQLDHDQRCCGYKFPTCRNLTPRSPRFLPEAKKGRTDKMAPLNGDQITEASNCARRILLMTIP